MTEERKRALVLRAQLEKVVAVYMEDGIEVARTEFSKDDLVKHWKLAENHEPRARLSQKRIEEIYLGVPPSTNFWWHFAKAIEEEVLR